MIELVNLNIRLGQGNSLVVPDMRLDKKGLTFISGDNGIGKTTLVRTILGIHRDYSGLIRLCNRDIRDLSRKEIASLASYLPQSPPIELEFTARDFIRQAFYTTQGDLDRVVDILGIRHLLDRRLTETSGGERQLIKIARALCTNSPIALLDEPDSYLSKKNKSKLIELWKTLQDEKTIVVITHDERNFAEMDASVIELV